MNDNVPSYTPEETERLNGHFRARGRSPSVTHLSEIYSTIMARLALQPRRMARPADDVIEVQLESYTGGGTTSHIAGILTDPFSGVRYRLVLVPENVTVILRPGDPA